LVHQIGIDTYNSFANRKFLVVKMASFSVAGFGTVLAFPPAGLSGGSNPDGGWVGLGGWFLRRVGFVALIVAMGNSK
jgi:hypothetical protein